MSASSNSGYQVQVWVVVLKSVATAATLAASGLYMHRFNHITKENRQGLSHFSQNIAIPALLFSRNVQCQRSTETDACPSLLDHLMSGGWILLLWPFYVVACGLLVGFLVTKLLRTPPQHRKSVLAAVALANSTGLPITLLTVIQTNLPYFSTSSTDGVDPNFFLSMYLVFYSLLQWIVGGFLLSSSASKIESESVSLELHPLSKTGPNGSEPSLSDLFDKTNERADHWQDQEHDSLEATGQKVEFDSGTNQIGFAAALAEACQPPVWGVLCGFAVAMIKPLRSLFVDTTGQNQSVVFGWFLDGVDRIGQAAVPVNMAVLGINLSSVARSNSAGVSGMGLSIETIMGVVLGKLVIMPCIGFASVLVLEKFVIDVSQAARLSYYLVLMIVFVTPTANNVMVMADLANEDGKESVARMIGYQYLAAPFLLPLSIFVMMHIALDTSAS